MKRNNWFSAIALFLSILACIVTWLRVEIYTTNDTFVGIMAGFIGICATLIVGTQIYNSIDTRNTINELNKSFEEKVKALAQSINSQLRDLRALQDQLNYELTNTKKELESAKEERHLSELKNNVNFHRAFSFSFMSTQPFRALIALFTALENALESGDAGTINRVINNLSFISKSIKKTGIETPPAGHKLIEKLDMDKYKAYKQFILVKDSVYAVYNDAIEVVSLIKNKNEIK